MGNAQTLLFVALVAVLVVVAALVLKRLAGRRYPAGALPYFSRRYLLSKGEAAFFRALLAALPSGLIVAPKVRVSDLIGCDGAAGKQGFGGRNSQKHVDFVLAAGRTTERPLVVQMD